MLNTVLLCKTYFIKKPLSQTKENFTTFRHITEATAPQ